MRCAPTFRVPRCTYALPMTPTIGISIVPGCVTLRLLRWWRASLVRYTAAVMTWMPSQLPFVVVGLLLRLLLLRRWTLPPMILTPTFLLFSSKKRSTPWMPPTWLPMTRMMMRIPIPPVVMTRVVAAVQSAMTRIMMMSLVTAPHFLYWISHPLLLLLLLHLPHLLRRLHLHLLLLPRIHPRIRHL